jgi:hypothetical protein
MKYVTGGRSDGMEEDEGLDWLFGEVWSQTKEKSRKRSRQTLETGLAEFENARVFDPGNH